MRKETRLNADGKLNLWPNTRIWFARPPRVPILLQRARLRPGQGKASEHWKQQPLVLQGKAVRGMSNLVHCVSLPGSSESRERTMALHSTRGRWKVGLENALEFG